MTANDTIHEQAQTALDDLNCVRLEPSIPAKAEESPRPSGRGQAP